MSVRNDEDYGRCMQPIPNNNNFPKPEYKTKHKAEDKCWKAGIEVELKVSQGQTRMGRTRHYGPLRIQRPFWPEGKELAHLYILHPPGGLVAGDEIKQSFIAHEGAAGLITTPAAGKIYFNRHSDQKSNQKRHQENHHQNRLQKQITHLKIHDQASLEWLPQETILFDGAMANMRTHIEIEGDGQYCGWDIVCLGRKASGESFTRGQMIQTIELTRNNQPLFKERFNLRAPSSLQKSPLGLNRHHVFGTSLMTLTDIPDCETLHHYLVRHDWQHVSALTWRKGVLIIRYLGNSPEQARTIFQSLWRLTRPQFIGRSACIPRIWNT